MSRYATAESAQKLVDLLKKKPQGMSGKQLRKEMGICESWFNAMVRYAKETGAIVRHGAARWTIWYAAEHGHNYVPPKRKPWEQRSADRKRLMNQLKDDGYSDLPPVRVVVPAGAVSMRKPGPASVFEIGAWV